jgi:outer membrane protein
LGVISGISQISADKQTIVSARNALKATEAGYVVGTRTMVDVLDDLSTVYQAQQQYADDQYRYINSTIALKESAGTLSVSDLSQINHWLKKNVTLDLPRSAFGSDGKSQPRYTRHFHHVAPRAKRNYHYENLPHTSKHVKKSHLKAPVTGKHTASLKAGTYTIQLYASKHKAPALRFIQSQPIRAKLNLMYMTPWYRVTIGQYSHYSNASAALKKLPSNLKRNKPWVIRVSSKEKATLKHHLPAPKKLKTA